MLINDNGITREATPEEEEKYSVVDPQPETDLTVNDTLEILNEFGVDTSD